MFWETLLEIVLECVTRTIIVAGAIVFAFVYYMAIRLIIETVNGSSHPVVKGLIVIPIVLVLLGATIFVIIYLINGIRKLNNLF